MRSLGLQVKLAPAGSHLRHEVTRARVKTGGWRCPVHVPTSPHGVKSRSLFYAGPQFLHFWVEVLVAIPTLVWFGFVCLLWLFHFVFDSRSPYLSWLNEEENGFTAIFWPKPVEKQNTIRRQRGQQCEPDQSFPKLKKKRKKSSGPEPSRMWAARRTGQGQG